MSDAGTVRTVRTATRLITYTDDGAVLDTDHGPYPVDTMFRLSRARHQNMEAVLTVDSHNHVVDIRVLERAKPLCGCCGGDGMHEYRAYAGGRSPEDEDTNCTNCQGGGRSEFMARRNSCTGYRSLHRRR